MQSDQNFNHIAPVLSSNILQPANLHFKIKLKQVNAVLLMCIQRVGNTKYFEEKIHVCALSSNLRILPDKN